MICPMCDGTGQDDYYDACPKCHGSGYIDEDDEDDMYDELRGKEVDHG